MNPLMRFFKLASAGWSLKDIGGRWHGYYEQYQTQRPIIASLVQRGHQLTGTMIDLENQTEHRLTELIVALDPTSAREPEEFENVSSEFPEFEPDQITYRSELPQTSELVGKRFGRQVQFSKHYLGEVYSSYTAGNQEMSFCDPGHAVEYRGKLTWDGETIEGQWFIDDPEIPGHSISGPFRLSKLDDSENFAID